MKTKEYKKQKEINHKLKLEKALNKIYIVKATETGGYIFLNKTLVGCRIKIKLVDEKDEPLKFSELKFYKPSKVSKRFKNKILDTTLVDEFKNFRGIPKFNEEKL